MNLLNVVIKVIFEHPIFGIGAVFLLGALAFLIFGYTGWAIACFVVAVGLSVLAIVVGK